MYAKQPEQILPQLSVKPKYCIADMEKFEIIGQTFAFSDVLPYRIGIFY